jgi:hypothetical protein
VNEKASVQNNCTPVYYNTPSICGYLGFGESHHCSAAPN